VKPVEASCRAAGKWPTCRSRWRTMPPSTWNGSGLPPSALLITRVTQEGRNPKARPFSRTVHCSRLKTCSRRPNPCRGYAKHFRTTLAFARGRGGVRAALLLAARPGTSAGTAAGSTTTGSLGVGERTTRGVVRSFVRNLFQPDSSRHAARMRVFTPRQSSGVACHSSLRMCRRSLRH